jgi:hypothetical protein
MKSVAQRRANVSDHRPRLILDRQLEMPWHVNRRIDATNDALLEGVQLQHAKLVGHGAN